MSLDFYDVNVNIKGDIMCKWGSYVYMELIIPPKLSCTGEAHKKIVQIDACIAPLVKTLNNAGFVTISCCCGHDKANGSIMLANGMELIIKKGK